jgi:hypothetical protein
MFGKGGPYGNCLDVMINWDKSIKFYIKEKNNIEPKAYAADKRTPLNINKCVEVAAMEAVSEGGATQDVQDTLLHWAVADNVTLPRRASEKNATYNYEATSTWAGYASI